MAPQSTEIRKKLKVQLLPQLRKNSIISYPNIDSFESKRASIYKNRTALMKPGNMGMP